MVPSLSITLKDDHTLEVMLLTQVYNNYKYVVNIKIDSLATPLIRVAAGQDEALALELVYAIEYIIRHYAE